MIACPSKSKHKARHYQTPPLFQRNDQFADRAVGQRMTIDNVTYKVAECREGREAAFRLLYEAYNRAGLMEANEYEMRVTPYHLLATTDVFVAIHQGEVICTLSLIGDGDLGIPMESIYAKEVSQLRDQQICFGEVSCLADRREYVADFLPVFVNLSALVIQHARHNNMDQLLIVVHPRHERFYGRLLGFERIGNERSYPSVCDKPAVA